MKSQKVLTNIIKCEKNDNGLHLCRAFKARPSMNRVNSWKRRNCYFQSANSKYHPLKLEENIAFSGRFLW